MCVIQRNAFIVCKEIKEIAFLNKRFNELEIAMIHGQFT